MDILSAAIKMEDEGAKFYRDLAAKTDSQAFKTVLTMLAEDEDKHQRIFEAWKNNDQVPMEDSKVITEANTVFKEVGKDDFISARNQLDLYTKARDKEAEAVEHYKALKEKPENASNIELIDRLIEEEKKHHALLTDLIEFISQPDSWVESAEFGLRTEY